MDEYRTLPIQSRMAIKQRLAIDYAKTSIKIQLMIGEANGFQMNMAPDKATIYKCLCEAKASMEKELHTLFTTDGDL